jgi:hypothetical protein
MSAVPENSPGHPLQNPNEVDGLNVALILGPLDVLKLALVALISKLINPRVILGGCPKLDKLSRQSLVSTSDPQGQEVDRELKWLVSDSSLH